VNDGMFIRCSLVYRDMYELMLDTVQHNTVYRLQA